MVSGKTHFIERLSYQQDSAVNAGQQVVVNRNLPQPRTALHANRGDLGSIGFDDVVRDQILLAPGRPRVTAIVGGSFVDRDVRIPDLALRVRLTSVRDE